MNGALNAGDHGVVVHDAEKEMFDEYNRYIVHGGEQRNVAGEHALYHERLFSFPPDGNNQIDAVI